MKTAYLVSAKEEEALNLRDAWPHALRPLPNGWWWIVPGTEGREARRLVLQHRRAR